MAEHQPKYNLDFSEFDNAKKELAEKLGISENELLRRALDSYNAHEKMRNSKVRVRPIGEPECEIGIHSGEFDPDLHY
jgi:hypothetical protein